MRKCSKMTKAGKQCKAAAMKGRSVCLFHHHANKYTGTPAKNTRRNIRRYNKGRK